jgi:site-specific DNA recombinase
MKGQAMSTNLLIEAPAVTKRAIPYLRVSSQTQAKTDYAADGLSIEVQREAAADKAVQLEAEIVDEAADPGKSAYVDLHKRTEFLELIDKLKRYNANPATFIHYVIVWKLDRWARNAEDHFHTRRLVRETGTQLISICEPMIGDDTPESFLYEGNIAINNQYQSMVISRGARLGIQKKASFGGTYGGRRLGYLSDIETLPDGRKVPIILVDPARGDYMTDAFKLYASGEYSFSQLATELYRLGLRTRPWTGHPETKVTSSQLQRALTNPYYAGWIAYKRGTPDEAKFKGRHPALIDQETFDKVQMRIDEKRVAGERPQNRRHYLRGSVFCWKCGSRLSYGLSTGRNGKKYAYFFCASRINGTDCTERGNLRPELIEQAIIGQYDRVELAHRDLTRRKAAIQAMADVASESLAYVRKVKTELIVRLEKKQDELVDMRFAERSISPETFKRQQEKLDTDIQAARDSLAETEGRLRLEAHDLIQALELAGDVKAVYEDVPETIKRGYNQAFFKRISIRARWDDELRQTVAEVESVELTEPYALLLAENATDEAFAWAKAIKAGKDPQSTRKRPDGALSGEDVSIFVKLAEGEGFEPSGQGLPDQQLSRLPHSTALPPLRALGDVPKASRSAADSAAGRAGIVPLVVV